MSRNNTPETDIRRDIKLGMVSFNSQATPTNEAAKKFPVELIFIARGAIESISSR